MNTWTYGAAPGSGRAGGFYFDQVEFPLQGELTIADLAKYPWPRSG